MLAEDATAYLGEAIDYLCDLAAEDILHVLHRVVCVLHHIVEQCGADACRAEPHLLAGDLGDGYGVHDIWFARQSLNPFVRLSGKIESLGDEVYFLSVP